MFETPPQQENIQAGCHLVLTDFPLTFQDLAKLQQEDPVLSG
jgi:hypothetical protein